MLFRSQLNALAGLDMTLPDPTGYYDQATPRPLYMMMPESFTNAGITREFKGKELFHMSGGNDWGEYSSAGTAPYQVDLLYGHVGVNSQLSITYKTKLKALMDASTDEAEKSKYAGMLAAAQRTEAARLSAAQASRQSGHWHSPERTMQYCHLRYSQPMVLAHTLPNSSLSEFAE